MVVRRVRVRALRVVRARMVAQRVRARMVAQRVRVRALRVVRAAA